MTLLTHLPIIHLQDVSVSIGDTPISSPGSSRATAPHSQVLLPPVSARVARGQIIAVRGENGSGKTTLLRVLAGLTRPSAGSAQICGTAPEERNPQFRRSVAALIGHPPTAPDLTVLDHVALVAATWHKQRHKQGQDRHRPCPRVSRRDTFSAVGRAAELAQSALSELGISRLSARYPSELSSGQQQLFALALVLVRPFDVLLLDEPEQRLDPDRVATLARALDSRRAAGSTIVFATHSDYLAGLIADDTIWLEGPADVAPNTTGIAL